MAFVADDLGAWLIGLLAEGARRKLINFVLGDEVERALRAAPTTAIRLTATVLWADDAGASRAGDDGHQRGLSHTGVGSHGTQQVTHLQALEAGIADQLAVLDNC